MSKLVEAVTAVANSCVWSEKQIRLIVAELKRIISEHNAIFSEHSDEMSALEKRIAALEKLERERAAARAGLKD
jgi:hypothetical protein